MPREERDKDAPRVIRGLMERCRVLSEGSHLTARHHGEWNECSLAPCTEDHHLLAEGLAHLEAGKVLVPDGFAVYQRMPLDVGRGTY